MNKIDIKNILISCVLVLLTVVSIILGSIFNFGVLKISKVVKSDSVNASGCVLGETINNGIEICATPLSVIDGKYESSYSVIAYVTPSTAYDQTINLSLAWADETSSWVTANNRVVTDYLSLSSTSIEGGESVTLYCYGAFGEEILVNAVAADNENVTATLKLEYVAAYTSAAFTFNNSSTGTASVLNASTIVLDDISSSETINKTLLEVNCGTGTIIDGIVDNTLTFTFNSVVDGCISYALDISGFNQDNTILSGYDYCYKSVNSVVFDWNTILGNLYGSGTAYNDLSDEDYNSIYRALITLYDYSNYGMSLTCSFVGDTSGNTYRFTQNYLINPEGIQIEVTGISWDTDIIYFS